MDYPLVSIIDKFFTTFHNTTQQHPVSAWSSLPSSLSPSLVHHGAHQSPSSTHPFKFNLAGSLDSITIKRRVSAVTWARLRNRRLGCGGPYWSITSLASLPTLARITLFCHRHILSAIALQQQQHTRPGEHRWTIITCDLHRYRIPYCMDTHRPDSRQINI